MLGLGHPRGEISRLEAANSSGWTVTDQWPRRGGRVGRHGRISGWIAVEQAELGLRRCRAGACRRCADRTGQAHPTRRIRRVLPRKIDDQAGCLAFPACLARKGPSTYGSIPNCRRASDRPHRKEANTSVGRCRSISPIHRAGSAWRPGPDRDAPSCPGQRVRPTPRRPSPPSRWRRPDKVYRKSNG